MIERNLAVISNRTRRGNLALRNDLRNSFRLERVLEKNSLTLKSKLVEERDRTLKGLALRSKQGEKDKKGGVGALGLLGGGAIAKRFFGRGRGTPKIPKLPTRGGASLSRIGRVGRLGRIGPLAVLGTGIDFAGRKAEGQTNLQAGLGAGGGLAGALAGGKAGAILGTAIGGPVGTLVGGIGGSIIGGLAGGRLADIFSGADRRRKFEEQRVEISTKKSLFSGALDDLDRVLDKLEETSIFTLIGRRRDTSEEETPILFKPFKGPGTARLVSEELAKYAAIAGVTFLLIPSDPTDVATTAPLAIKLQALARSTRLFKALKAIFVKPPKFLQPGKDIPGISAKGIKIRAEALLKKLNPKIKFPPPKPKFKKIKTKVKDSDVQDLIKRGNLSKESPIFELFKPKTRTKTINPDAITGGGKNINPSKKIGGESNTSENLEIMKKIERRYPDLFSDAGGASAGDIALAPTNNIFLINQDNSQKSSPTIIQGGDTIVIGGKSVNPYDISLNIAMMESLQTA